MLKLLVILLAMLAINTVAAQASFDTPYPYGRSYDPNVEAQIDQMERERERQMRLLDEIREDQRRRDACQSDSCREVFNGRMWATEQEARQRPR